MRAFLVGTLVAGMALQPAGARAAGAGASAGSRAASVGVSSVTSPSDAAVEATRTVVRERERELVGCYEQELSDDPEPTTRVVLSFTLRANGSISTPKAEFPDARLDDAGFAFLGCLTDKVAGWKARKPGAGGPVEVGLTFSARGGPRPTAQNVPLVGSIGKEALSKVFQEHAGEISACYGRELARDKGLEGKVKLRWNVQADGAVTDVRVDDAGTSLPNRSAVECMVARVGTWRFPSPKNGAIAVITNTWTLRAQVQESGAKR